MTKEQVVNTEARNKEGRTAKGMPFIIRYSMFNILRFERSE